MGLYKIILEKKQKWLALIEQSNNQVSIGIPSCQRKPSRLDRLMLELAVLHLQGTRSSPQEWVETTREGWETWTRSAFRLHTVTRPRQLRVCLVGLGRSLLARVGYYRLRLRVKKMSARQAPPAAVEKASEAWRESYMLKGMTREQQDRVRLALQRGLENPKSRAIGEGLAKALREASRKGIND